MSRLVNRFGIATVALAAVLIVAGCATPAAPGYYHRSEAMRAQSVEMGVVENVRPVALQGPDTGLGALGGAASVNAVGSSGKVTCP